MSAMLDDILMDVTLQVHQEAARNRAVCNVCHTRCGLVHVPGPSAPQGSGASSIPPTPGSSIGGINAGANTTTNGSNKGDGNVYFDCLNCSRSITSNRYAPHLSSCMGIGARKGAARSVNVKSKMSSDHGQSKSPSFQSEIGDMSDDAKPLKNKGKSKAKQADEAEYNVTKKRPASPMVSPSKKKKSATGSPLVQAKTEPDLTNGTASPFKVPASKLRESSITSALDKSSMRSRSSSIDSHSSASTRTSSILSGRGVAFPNGSPTKNNRNNLPKPPSPPRMPPPARIPEPDFMIDVEGDETGSSTDTDDSS
ncbi:hypothetical protein GLOTRDRAFT_135533 [Gloeophyllum trabeum ATCC 11539]|uniref:SAGA-associated factor 11 n=1 Tax=Gloeophyllum trabeum (strain ATCC 11539 / FP-39264 / Madison 617) TaxID=670483 RepID=S7S4U1_GLOTA|nr:uncharacterized protein GLOTRDRAFT_135533 [Gloeophyllum trabeum ATCC 11539]EPQ60944.1 hypothetical protein GLOTRDRAFT_135533 [Gloeophyllum trabeum ATCC 11539]